MRKLTLKREKSFVASIMKAYIYLQSNSGELDLGYARATQVGVLKNSEELTLEIPNEGVYLFVVFDKLLPKKYNTSFWVPEGKDDIALFTKAKFNPFKGNPFMIYQK